MKKTAPTGSVASLLLWFLLAASGAELILSLGTSLAYLIATAVHEVPAFLVLRLFESAGLLLLLMTLGVAFGAVKLGHPWHGVLYLAEASLAHLFGSLMVLVWQALLFRQPVTAEKFALLLGNMLDSLILPLFVTYGLALWLFLSKAPADEPKSPRDLSSSPVRAAVLASSLLFAYRLYGQILTTQAFLEEESFDFTFLETSEIISEIIMLFLDYILVFAISAGGYFLLLLARRLYLKAAALLSKKEK